MQILVNLDFSPEAEKIDYTRLESSESGEAFYTLYLYLYGKYLDLNDSVKAKEIKMAVLKPNPNDKEVIYRIRYAELQNRGLEISFGVLPTGLLGKLSISDSTLLATVAQSGTSVAEAAKMQLQMYCPTFYSDTRMTYNPSIYDTLQCDTAFAAGRKAKVNQYKESIRLGDARPNPAVSETAIDYEIGTEFNNAILEFFHLVTGETISKFAIEKKSAIGTWYLNTAVYSSGIFGYRLWVDEKVWDTKKLVIFK